MAPHSESTSLVHNSKDDDENMRKLKKYQPWAFFVTFGGYFMAHFSRKCYSTVKTQLQTHAGYSPLILSEMDTVFMGTYAAGNIISGKLGDTYNPTTVLAIGLFGGGACLFLINLSLWFDFLSMSVFFGNAFVIAVYALFGFFQSTGGPVGTAVMGNWFCDKKSVENRGLIFGLWTCHQYCGDVTAALCTAAILGANWDYTWAIFVPAVVNVGWAFLTMRLVADPADAGIVTPEVKIRLEKLKAMTMSQPGQSDSSSRCCIGMSKGSSRNDFCYQQSYHLISPKKSSPTPQSPTRHQYKNDVEAISTSASSLEDAICSFLAPDDAAGDTFHENALRVEEEEGSDDVEEFNPVQVFDSDDVFLLRCRPLISNDDGQVPSSTIFGIREIAASLGGTESDTSVRVTVFEPSRDSSGTNSNQEQEHSLLKECCCCHPRGNWRRQHEIVNGYTGPRVHDASKSSYHANVKIVDLTKIQDLRRSFGRDEQLYPCFDTPARVFHLLRSVLNQKPGGLHSASPWNQYYCNDKKAEDNDGCNGVPCPSDQVVALLVKNPNNRGHANGSDDNDNQFWDAIEQTEVNELLEFRVSDAAPSYFLHSASRLSGGSQLDFVSALNDASPSEREQILDANSSLSSKTMLVVYRHLPPRDILSRPSLEQEEKYAGCLQETYFEEADEAELDIGLDQPAGQALPVLKHRMVSPPYQSHAHEFPGLLDTLLKHMDSIRKEAQTIPQWTAWPEQSHYAEDSWNVFPLCHTFPANDISKRKFIQKTCSFVPETQSLLQTLGPALRTALFSRLNPRARLGAHTGWKDLANHVVRVHIPLIVPGGKCKRKRKGDNYNYGLCGTWVDGCVETHEEGAVVCFDDSKVHRAFNYSDEERIVLIVDLARPCGLPMGTATGGHSDELDSFISGF